MDDLGGVKSHCDENKKFLVLFNSIIVQRLITYEVNMKKYKTILLLLILFHMGFVGVVKAENLNYEELDSKTLTALAEKGDDEAQYQLGNLYFLGEDGVKHDVLEAKKWYEVAVNAKNSKAEYKLGWLYLHGALHLDGRGVFRNTEKALTLLQKAADNKNADAIYLLGIVYFNGRSYLPSEKEKGLEYISIAAEKGNYLAMGFLWRIYIEGQFVDKDIKKAKFWYNKALESGNEEILIFNEMGEFKQQDFANVDKIEFTEHYDQQIFLQLKKAKSDIDDELIWCSQKEDFTRTACICDISVNYKKFETLLNELLKKHPNSEGKLWTYNKDGRHISTKAEQYIKTIKEFNRKTCSKE